MFSAAAPAAEKVEFRGRAYMGLDEQTYTLSGVLDENGPSNLLITFDPNPEAGLAGGTISLPQACDRYPTHFWSEATDPGYKIAEFQICDKEQLPANTLLSSMARMINHFEFVVIARGGVRRIGSSVLFSDGYREIVNMNADGKPILLEESTKRRNCL